MMRLDLTWESMREVIVLESLSEDGASFFLAEKSSWEESENCRDWIWMLMEDCGMH